MAIVPGSLAIVALERRLFIGVQSLRSARRAARWAAMGRLRRSTRRRPVQWPHCGRSTNKPAWEEPSGCADRSGPAVRAGNANTGSCLLFRGEGPADRQSARSHRPALVCTQRAVFKWHRMIRDSGWKGRVVTAYRPDAVVDPDFDGFSANLDRPRE